jgi:hypothetical protein
MHDDGAERRARLPFDAIRNESQVAMKTDVSSERVDNFG